MATKRCPTCTLDKPLDDFYRNAATRDGRRNECKTCSVARSARWRKAHPQRSQGHRRQHQLGVTPIQFAQMLAAQNGVCAICHEAPTPPRKSLATDHSRKTGRIRGLLCANCNTGLGLFKHDPERLSNAMTYLLQAQEFPVN